jgi:glycosyltransferase involved in cell wall biosynthesis
MFKILIVHNCYQQAGGEDTVVAAETELLINHGHQVELWKVDNKDLPGGLRGKIKAALSTSYSSTSKAIAREKLRHFKPDIVHVHNFFPQISPSVYDACAEENVPVVQTLHNYRLICPGALLLRDGKVCELCVTGSPYHAALYGCYRGSKAGSLVVAHMVAQHRDQQTWNHKVSRFIALTEFAKAKFVEAGFPAHKIAIKPNFVKPHASEALRNKPSSPYALFVGRLSEEKGIKTLAKAWQKLDGCCKLKVVGDGALKPLLENNSNIETLGFQNQASIHELMQNATFLVMPSECYETFGMVLIESFSHGLPVIASNLGAMSEIVSDCETGLLFEPSNSDELANKVRWLVSNPEERQRMGMNAKAVYLSNYTPDHNLQLLLDIYGEALLVYNH